jgi:hypothetical protein
MRQRISKMSENGPQPNRSQALDEARLRRVPRVSKPTSIHVPHRLTALGKGEAKPPLARTVSAARSHTTAAPALAIRSC